MTENAKIHQEKSDVKIKIISSPALKSKEKYQKNQWPNIYKVNVFCQATQLQDKIIDYVFVRIFVINRF